MAQSMLLPRMNLVDEPTMISGSRIRMGQFSMPLLERLRPAEIDGHLLGLFPGLGEEQRVVDVDLRRGVFPFLLQLLEAIGHDHDGPDLFRRFGGDRAG